MPRRSPSYAPLPPPGAAACADGVLSVREAAAFAGLSVRTARALVASGRWVVVRVGRRVLVPRRALAEWLGRRASGGKGGGPWGTGLGST